MEIFLSFVKQFLFSLKHKKIKTHTSVWTETTMCISREQIVCPPVHLSVSVLILFDSFKL